MPTFNRGPALEHVVAPLLADPETLELIVVVDGSRDGSLELLERIAHGEPRLRPMLIENRGEMGARAAGAGAARADAVLFVDDDVLGEPGLVSGHARHHTRAERHVVLGYMPVRLERPRRPGDFASWIYADEYERACDLYERDPRRVLTHLWGGNFSMRRDDCLAVGMRNPAYSERYHPDRDFGLRCLEAGLSGKFDRSLRATHLHERSLPAYVRDARSQGAARVILHRMHALGPLPPDSFERGLPAPARAIVRAAGRRRAAAALSASLRGLVAVAGALHLWRVEDAAARLLRRVEQRRGALTTPPRAAAG
jgi:glycosyltransferase involved in cell wall biosynthesis